MSSTAESIDQMSEIEGQMTIYDELHVDDERYYTHNVPAGKIHIDLFLAKLVNNGSEFGLRLAIRMVEEYERRGKAKEVLTPERMPFLSDLREVIYPGR